MKAILLDKLRSNQSIGQTVELQECKEVKRGDNLFYFVRIQGLAYVFKLDQLLLLEEPEGLNCNNKQSWLEDWADRYAAQLKKQGIEIPKEELLYS